MNTERKGFFVVLEGSRGSGKSTLMDGIGNRFENESYFKDLGLSDLVTTREIGGTVIGEQIRDIFTGTNEPGRAGNWDPPTPHTELLLINASRRESLAQVILPALLNESVMVISDRFLPSSYAFQSMLKGVNAASVFKMHQDFCWNIYPDLTVWIDAPVTTCISRTSNRTYPIPDTPEARERMETVEKGYRRYGVTLEHHSMKGALPGCDGVVDMGEFHRVNGLFSEKTVLDRVTYLIGECYGRRNGG